MIGGCSVGEGSARGAQGFVGKTRSIFLYSSGGIPVGNCRVCTHRLGLELGVDLVQAGVEAPEGADVLLIIPGHLVGVTLCFRYMRGGNERADLFSVELFETVGFKGGLVGPQFTSMGVRNRLVNSRGDVILTAMTSLSPVVSTLGAVRLGGFLCEVSSKLGVSTVSIECEFDRGLIDDAIAGAINCVILIGDFCRVYIC